MQDSGSGLASQEEFGQATVDPVAGPDVDLVAGVVSLAGGAAGPGDPLPGHAALVGGGGGLPPVLTGGVKPETLGGEVVGLPYKSILHVRGIREFLGESVDFWTGTVSSEGGAALRGVSSFDEPGGKVQGFSRSESRVFMGGKVWRRWEPVQKSGKWGKEYESWQAPGESANGWAREMLKLDAGRSARTSRVDVAFDFTCEADFLADDLERIVRPWYVAGEFKPGICGEGGVNTHYIGSREEVRVRIYRKDLEDNLCSAMYGPVMRVEVEFHKGRSVPIWESFVQGGMAGGFSAAAFAVSRLIGLLVRPDALPYSELVQPDGKGLICKIVALVKQWGPSISALDLGGFSLVDLCRRYAAQGGKSSQWRQRKMGEELAESGPDVAMRLSEMILLGEVSQ